MDVMCLRMPDTFFSYLLIYHTDGVSELCLDRSSPLLLLIIFSCKCRSQKAIFALKVNISSRAHPFTAKKGMHWVKFHFPHRSYALHKASHTCVMSLNACNNSANDRHMAAWRAHTQTPSKCKVCTHITTAGNRMSIAQCPLHNNNMTEWAVSTTLFGQFQTYAINLLLPFHYRIHRSAEWSILISLCPLPVRRYCVVEFVFAVDPCAFVVANDAYADGYDDGDDDDFVDAEWMCRSVCWQKIRLVQRLVIQSDRRLKWKKCPPHFLATAHCVRSPVFPWNRNAFFQTTICWIVQSIRHFQLMTAPLDWWELCGK